MDAAPEPGWSDEAQSFVVKVTEHWIVSVTPMIFNDRICLTSRQEWPNSYVAGWCYTPRGRGAALAAAVAWDPETEREPIGYLKCAGDQRAGSLL